jgi:hypothetical protein
VCTAGVIPERDGHVVVIGNDFTTIVDPTNDLTKTWARLLANAVRLAPRSPTTNQIEVALYAAGASGPEELDNPIRAVKTWAPEANIVMIDGADLKAELVGKSVLLVPDQNEADLTALSASWNAPINDFLKGGGVIIALSGSTRTGELSTTWKLLNGTAVLELTGAGLAGAARVSSDTAEPLTAGIVAMTIASPAGVFFRAPSTAGVPVVASNICEGHSCAFLPLVIHRTNRLTE